MAGKSDYLEAEALKWATGQTNDMGTAPTPYVALFTVAPTDAGGGTEVSTSGTAYARVDSSTDWGAPSGTAPTSVSNSAEITFAQATADWGTVVAFAIFDAATTGNMLYWGNLSASKSVGTNETARFDIGALTLTED